MAQYSHQGTGPAFSLNDGDDHSDGGSGEDREMTEEQEEWSLELIQEALTNVAKPDKLSAYERRVALREMKDIIRSALSQGAVEPHDERVRKYLGCNEEVDGTLTQLNVLKEEMKKLLSMTQQLDSLKRDLCRSIATEWEKRGHKVGDLLEVRIKAGGEGIPATQHSLTVLQAILDVWCQPPPPAGDSAPPDASRMRLLLESCAVPRNTQDDLIKHLQNRGTIALNTSTDRLAASLGDYGMILASLHKLDRMPDPRGNDPVADAGPSSSSPSQSAKEPQLASSSTHWERVDAWRQSAEDLEKKCRQWEILSGVPLYVTIGSHFLVRSKNREETLVAVLQAAVGELNSVGC